MMMKTTLTALAATGLVAFGTFHASAGLVLTGLVDGPLTGGAPKAVEFFATEDIADLSIYGIELVSNAGSSAGVVETAFAGSILAGEYYYIATESVEFANVFGFAPDLETNDANHNGDDDFYLYQNGVVIDTWGGSDGIDNTDTVADVLDSWAYRLDNTGPSATFDATEWTIAAPNSLDDLDAAGVSAAVPFGSYAVPEPASLALLSLGGVTLLGRRRA